MQVYGDRVGVVDEPDQPAPSLGELTYAQLGQRARMQAAMLDKLGILEQMKNRTTLVNEGYAVAPVGRGEVELGIHQISEILPVPGVKLVGPLPAESGVER